MTYLRVLGNLILRMAEKHDEKGQSYLDMSLKDLWGKLSLRYYDRERKDRGECDGLLGEMQELHAEIMPHLTTGEPMTPAQIERAINESDDVAIYALLIGNWLRHKKAEWS